MDDADFDASGHEETPDSPQNASGSASIRRACDACRARKHDPRRSGLGFCSPPNSKFSIPILNELSLPSDRVKAHHELSSERKIDLIDKRLQGVTQLLEDLRMNCSPPSSQPPKDVPSINAPRSSGISTPFGNAMPSDSDSPLVEGNSSLAAHSVFANEFLQNAVRTGSLQDSSLEMRETLDSLHHIVDTLRRQSGASEMSYPHANPVQRTPLQGIELPPIEKSVSIIRAGKKNSFDGASWLYYYIPSHRFPEICMGVYFSDDYSESDFIMVNAGLHYLFWDRATRVEGKEKEECLKWTNMCQTNLETALASLPLHLPATADMIVALVFGAFHAIELSKPSLSWILVSKASELCQTLGYHRISSMKKDDREELEYKQLLFWSVYYLDKSLSLRLGRASTIPDWDITVPDPVSDTPSNSLLAPHFYIWCVTARCQGKIYEQLYSPESITQPDHVRTSRVQALVQELGAITAQADETNKKWFAEPKEEGTVIDMAKFFIISDKVLRCSLLTLIYRACPAPPGSTTTFSKDCIDAARGALQQHHDCMVSLEEISSVYFPSYVHWTVLFAPFIPFIVIFCQVIETRDQTDLARLHAFITSIQSAPSVSDAAAKMYRLFQVLYSVALRYIELQNTTPPVGQSQASAELDNYLAVLGFPSAGFDNQQQQQTTNFGQANMADGMDQTGLNNMNPMMWMGNTAQLDDWFNSNQQMMGLLQETNFDFPPEHQ
ncbi:Fc.00g049390.m01.CDS01 [Cosmosporella sp. VM-42]